MKQFKWLPLAAFLLQACGSQLIPENPRLVVYFVVDQMPAELIQRIESEFTGGLGGYLTIVLILGMPIMSMPIQ